MSTWGRVRRALARVVAACAAVFWGFLFFGLQDFLTPFVGGEEFATHFLLESGWGLTYLVLVGAPLLVLVVRPGASVALLELTAVAIALGVGGLLAGSPSHLLPALAVLLTAALLALLGGPRRGHGSLRPGRLTRWVTLVALAPAGAYAWQMARATESPEETWGLDHYPVQAAFAIAVVLTAFVASYAAARGGRGRWLPALTAAFSAIWIGSLSLAWPERLGSLGITWGLLAITWGLALLLAVTLDGRAPAPADGAGTTSPLALHGGDQVVPTVQGRMGARCEPAAEFTEQAHARRPGPSRHHAHE